MCRPVESCVGHSLPLWAASDKKEWDGRAQGSGQLSVSLPQLCEVPKRAFGQESVVCCSWESAFQL